MFLELGGKGLSDNVLDRANQLRNSKMKLLLGLVSVLIILVSVDLSSNVCYVTLTDKNGQQTILTGKDDYYVNLEVFD
jgi:hypothetical protein